MDEERDEDALEIEGGVVRITATTPITAARIRASVDRYLAHPGFRPGLGILWDVRVGGTSALSRADLEELGPFSRHKRRRGQWSKIAYLVTRDIDYGMARMYESLRQLDVDEAPPDDVETRVFRDEADALAWLREPAPSARTIPRG